VHQEAEQIAFKETAIQIALRKIPKKLKKIGMSNKDF